MSNESKRYIFLAPADADLNLQTTLTVEPGASIIDICAKAQSTDGVVLIKLSSDQFRSFENVLAWIEPKVTIIRGAPGATYDLAWTSLLPRSPRMNWSFIVDSGMLAAAIPVPEPTSGSLTARGRMPAREGAGTIQVIDHQNDEPDGEQATDGIT